MSKKNWYRSTKELNKPPLETYISSADILKKKLLQNCGFTNNTKLITNSTKGIEYIETAKYKAAARGNARYGLGYEPTDKDLKRENGIWHPDTINLDKIINNKIVHNNKKFGNYKQEKLIKNYEKVHYSGIWNIKYEINKLNIGDRHYVNIKKIFKLSNKQIDLEINNWINSKNKNKFSMGTVINNEANLILYNSNNIKEFRLFSENYLLIETTKNKIYIINNNTKLNKLFNNLLHRRDNTKKYINQCGLIIIPNDTIYYDNITTLKANLDLNTTAKFGV